MDKKIIAARLSDDEILALGQAMKLKARARHKFDDSVYKKLLSLGYIKSNKSITNAGRSYLLDEGRNHFNKVNNNSKDKGLMSSISDSYVKFYREKYPQKLASMDKVAKELVKVAKDLVSEEEEFYFASIPELKHTFKYIKSINRDTGVIDIGRFDNFIRDIKKYGYDVNYKGNRDDRWVELIKTVEVFGKKKVSRYGIDVNENEHKAVINRM